MKVKELIELLELFDKDLEVVVDGLNLGKLIVYESEEYYQDKSVVVVGTK